MRLSREILTFLAELNLNPVVLELLKEKETYTSSSRNISSNRQCKKNMRISLA